MKTGNITFVIGGCRSGKSSFALDQANKLQANMIHAGMEKSGSKIFIATSVPTDSEMEKRVKKHQDDRGDDWHTIEEPVKIHEPISKYSSKANVILVDCLTLWVSNLMFSSPGHEQANQAQIGATQIDEAQIDHTRIGQDRIDRAVQQLESSLKLCQCPVFLVSNEVGAGIVPENTIARQFRDYAGFVNQRMAKFADRVVMTVAGIDVQIKPK